MKTVLFLAAFKQDAEALAVISKDVWAIKSIFNNDEVVPILAQNKYDFLLFDFEAPGSFPPSILKRIYTAYPKLPLFLFSRQHCSFVERKAAATLKIDGCFAIPYEFSYLYKKINNLLAKRKATCGYCNADHSTYKYNLLNEHLQGESIAIQEVRNLIIDISKQEQPVLIYGESGTGKEIVASLIHQYSSYHKGEYVPLNVSCIPEGIAESVLFGCCKGAFTGAVNHQGMFSKADNGTLFLDEIETMPLILQSKLLRVLETNEFYQVGGSEKLFSNFRLICATNEHLPDLILQGEFRKDLYYRLDVLRISLPPLRAHKNDIPLIANHYLKKVNKELSDDAIALLSEYSWPGNVRELLNCLDRAIPYAQDSTIVFSHNLDI
ncbi:MAG: sigma 54-interacting transcriptional regulator [Treponema sp.]